MLSSMLPPEDDAARPAAKEPAPPPDPAQAGAPSRGNRPTLAELRAVSQPDTVVGRRNSEHWAGMYLRKGSIHLTRLLLPTGISANAVTWLMIVVGFAGALVLAIPGWWPVIAAAVLIQLHILVDCSDGEVARWRNQHSTAGVYIDRVGHYLVESLLPIALGVHLDGGPGSVGGWTTVGALVAVVVILKKSFGDLVHVARTYSGWPKMSEDAELAAPRSGGLRSLRGLLRFFPFFRAFGAIEFTLILAVLATVDLVLRLAGLEAAAPGGGWWSVGDQLAYEAVLRAWMVLAIPLSLATAAGYLLSILASNRLRRP
ncbi:MAG: CDP-diacylglycerol--glycerol-3-phosphate 3-phosphatidyltransferase [uncultured Propionibacteriaceae bacterium]|uniref:CDP-diacylglycerol--glycerol-3-phosphate 3-phosphatidyltransferase n=1 Tax=uncultured Propionibacteriaceae bacterium TaxID=257457 RepID=A0A6J4N711_9ACTN|nr:MAG: CDP-diacylglycerol--glycerol-3-phosphate 3-phosphatidyltransferase [uncultured Propionibacteriaceae bacterium]